MEIQESLYRHIIENRRVDANPIVCSLKQNLRQACEDHLNPESPGYIDYTDRKADFWGTRSGGRLLPKSIETLAVGGILLDRRYAAEACNILRTIVKYRIVENCGGTNYGRPYRTWRDNCLDAGASSTVLAIGLDLLRRELSDAERREIGTYFLPFIDYTLENPPDPEETRPDWNMGAIGCIGLGLLGLVLRNYGVLDESRFNRALESAKKRCLLFLDRVTTARAPFTKARLTAAPHCITSPRSPWRWPSAEIGNSQTIRGGNASRKAWRMNSYPPRGGRIR